MLSLALSQKTSTVAEQTKTAALTASVLLSAPSKRRGKEKKDWFFFVPSAFLHVRFEDLPAKPFPLPLFSNSEDFCRICIFSPNFQERQKQKCTSSVFIASFFFSSSTELGCIYCSLFGWWHLRRWCSQHRHGPAGRCGHRGDPPGHPGSAPPAQTLRPE